MSNIKTLKDAVMQGNANLAVETMQAALDEGVDVKTILDDALISAMDELGEGFSEGEVFIPEMLIAARAMQACINILKPLLLENDIEPLGQCVIGTVRGDKHDIGKNLVKLLVETKGFEVVDLGADVAPEAFVAHVKENPTCKFVFLSALLTTTMPAMKEVIDALEEAGVRKQVKVFVGGAPVTEEYAKTIGADCYTADAALCASQAEKWCE